MNYRFNPKAAQVIPNFRNFEEVSVVEFEKSGKLIASKLGYSKINISCVSFVDVGYVAIFSAKECSNQSSWWILGGNMPYMIVEMEPEANKAEVLVEYLWRLEEWFHFAKNNEYDYNNIPKLIDPVSLSEIRFTNEYVYFLNSRSEYIRFSVLNRSSSACKLPRILEIMKVLSIEQRYPEEITI